MIKIEIERMIVTLLAKRDASASICPSEVARALEGDEAQWRAAMPLVRDVAADLARTHVIRITQGESTIEPNQVQSARGPIRLRRGDAF